MTTITPDLTIHKTKEYDKFKFFEYNRGVDERHVEALKDSISQCDDSHLNPILVTPDFHIINGQHRFHACKELSWPIYYIVDYNYSNKKLFIHNTLQKSWKMIDIVNYYVNLGEAEYIKLNDFLRKYNLTLSAFHILCSEELRYGTFSTPIKEGKYKFKITDEAIVLVEDYNKFRNKLIEQGFKANTMFFSTSFLRAYKAFFSTPGIYFSRFFDKYIASGKIYNYYNTMPLHLNQFAKIYNYDSRGKDRVIIITRTNGSCQVGFEEEREEGPRARQKSLW